MTKIPRSCSRSRGFLFCLLLPSSVCRQHHQFRQFSLAQNWFGTVRIGQYHGCPHYLIRTPYNRVVGQRLLSIPYVGTLTASTISTEIGDGKQYASSRDFAAATRLVPRQYSTGGRTTLLGISKRGNKKIRALLVQCARVFIQKLEYQSGRLADWVRELLCRKSNFVVTCALANKLARIAWALTTRQQTYEA